MSTENTITVVIPVLGDGEVLANILERFGSWSAAPDEIVVVDGAADGRCEAVCTNYGCIYLRAAPGRGNQLDAGAGHASGHIIWFLHADSRPPESAIGDIHAAISDGAAGGFFRFEFTGKSAWHKRMLAWLINLRCRFGIPYGDQGLFILRSTYRDIGGFPDTPLFEEVPLVKAARRKGRFVQLTNSIGVSPRRWERDGWIKRTFANRMLALGYAVGISPTVLARRYQAQQTALRE